MTMIAGFLLTGCLSETVYRKPTNSGKVIDARVVDHQKRFTTEIRGKLEVRPSGLYLVSSQGDYRIDTGTVFGQTVVIRGSPVFDAKSGVITIEVYEIVRE